jgi:hypothetical protein
LGGDKELGPADTTEVPEDSKKKKIKKRKHRRKVAKETADEATDVGTGKEETDGTESESKT